jgi:hypothetical protein
LPSTLHLDVSPLSPSTSQDATFTVTLAAAEVGAFGSHPLAKETVRIDFGDGGAAAEAVTDSAGQAVFMHAYADAGNVTVAAAFAGGELVEDRPSRTAIPLFSSFKKLQIRWPLQCFPIWVLDVTASTTYGCDHSRYFSACECSKPDTAPPLCTKLFPSVLPDDKLCVLHCII